MAQPGPEVDPSVAGETLIDALKSGEVTIAVGAGLMLAVWVLRVFVFPNVSAKALPWIAVAIAAVGTLAVALVADPAQWLSAIVNGVLAGLAAAGTYGLLPSGVKEKMKAAVEKRKT